MRVGYIYCILLKKRWMKYASSKETKEETIQRWWISSVYECSPFIREESLGYPSWVPSMTLWLGSPYSMILCIVPFLSQLKFGMLIYINHSGHNLCDKWQSITHISISLHLHTPKQKDNEATSLGQYTPKLIDLFVSKKNTLVDCQCHNRRPSARQNMTENCLRR